MSLEYKTGRKRHANEFLSFVTKNRGAQRSDNDWEDSLTEKRRRRHLSFCWKGMQNGNFSWNTRCEKLKMSCTTRHSSCLSFLYLFLSWKLCSFSRVVFSHSFKLLNKKGWRTILGMQLCSKKNRRCCLSIKTRWRRRERITKRSRCRNYISFLL